MSTTPEASAAFAERAERYRGLVEAEMREIVGTGPAELFGWMRYHLGWEDAAGRPAPGSPGKRLRPVALLLATELVGGEAAPASPAAAAVELVHAFSLVHDDVMDGSRLRRERPALWTISGPSQAINTGDGLFTLAHYAMHRLSARGYAERRILDAMRELAEGTVRLVEGQYLDISFEQRADVATRDYLVMAAGKTAAMFACPFAIGALLGGAEGRVVAAFREFGARLGIAFQAVDDVLGAWGDPAVTGKPAGDDLRTRKKSYPVVWALESGTDRDPDAARELAAVYATPPPDDPAAADAEADRLAALVERAGGREEATRLAADESAAALDAVEAAGLGTEAVALLRAFAESVIARER